MLTSADALIGTAWLYALHVRSSLARGRVWQADLLLHRLREQVVMLACLRHGLPTRDGRGVDLLPVGYRRSLGTTFVSSIQPADLVEAFEAAVELLLAEVRPADAAPADRLAASLATMVATTGRATGAGSKPDR